MNVEIVYICGNKYFDCDIGRRIVMGCGNAVPLYMSGQNSVGIFTRSSML